MIKMEKWRYKNGTRMIAIVITFINKKQNCKKWFQYAVIVQFSNKTTYQIKTWIYTMAEKF